MNNSIKTRVLDGGGRYGLHPTWKSFSGELEYYLFEPDQQESERLKEKYARRSDEIFIFNNALLNNEGKTFINYFRNRAMSSMCNRNPVVSQYQGEREFEPEIVDSQEVDVITIDSFCRNNNVDLDFLKLDTEGSEFLILQGAEEQIAKDVLGICCEVAFDRIFEGMAMFSEIHEWMINRGFFLLNLTYDGRGDYSNEFVNLKTGKYGILTNCDAVWLKRCDHLFETSNSDQMQVAAKVFKYAAFCMANSATDLAIDILLKAKEKHYIDFQSIAGTRLYSHLDKSIQKLFYSLKWQPGQSIERHKSTYKFIFEKPMLQMHEFNESTEMNPD